MICKRHESRKTSGGKALTDVEVIHRKEAKITNKEDNQGYSNFPMPQKIVYCMILSYKTLSWYQLSSQECQKACFFSFRDSP